MSEACSFQGQMVDNTTPSFLSRSTLGAESPGQSAYGTSPETTTPNNPTENVPKSAKEIRCQEARERLAMQKRKPGRAKRLNPQQPKPKSITAEEARASVFLANEQTSSVVKKKYPWMQDPLKCNVKTGDGDAVVPHIKQEP